MKTKKNEHAKSLSDAAAEFLRVNFSALPDNAPERQTVKRDFDNALHAAGVYREATRLPSDIQAELLTAHGDRKTVLEHALRLVWPLRQYSINTMKALNAAKTFEERERIRAREIEVRDEAERQRLEAGKSKIANELAKHKADEMRRAEDAREKAEHEKRFQEATIQLADDIAQSKTIKKKSDIKRARKNRINGKTGGRSPIDPEEKITAAVQGVCNRMKNNPSLGMKRACQLECRHQGLSIKWEALRKHVKKSRGGRVTN